LQLQNNSALGVEVNPKAYSCTLCFDTRKAEVLNSLKMNITAEANDTMFAMT